MGAVASSQFFTVLQGMVEQKTRTGVSPLLSTIIKANKTHPGKLRYASVDIA